MHFAHGNCGHLKAKWDNHPSCISCTACQHISPCSICSIWTKKVWDLAEKRRLYATRKSVMTQKRKQEKSKKNKISTQSDKSDNGSIDGSTTPLSYTARGRTHQGGSPGDLESDWALSPPVTSHPVTGHTVTSHLVIGQPVTGQPVTGQQITGHPVTTHPITCQLVYSHPVTGQPVTSQPVTGQLVYGQPVTDQPATGQSGTSHQSLTSDFQTPITNQFISGYSPVNVPQQTYAPSVSSHVSQGSTRRPPNIHHSGYEHSEVKEFPNPATSSKQLIPLEPDLQMSDPSVIIDPPNSTDYSQT